MARNFVEEVAGGGMHAARLEPVANAVTGVLRSASLAVRMIGLGLAVALSLVAGHGRCTPLLWKTVRSSRLRDRRNDCEDELLDWLRQLVAEDVKVTILADRGFADCVLFEFLERLGFEYVIRLRGNFAVESESGEKRRAADWIGPGGRARTLRDAAVTDANRWRAATVACMKDRGMKEPWCLVSSERKGRGPWLCCTRGGGVSERQW